MNEVKNWFLKKINKIDKPLPDASKQKQQSTQIKRSEMEEKLQITPQK